MFGIKIQTPKWEWATDEEGNLYAFQTHGEAKAKAVELGYTTYIIDVIS